MNTPFFSIIIPIYNRAWSIKRAVESAISFSAKLSVEIIIIDDASTDESPKIINQIITQNNCHPEISLVTIRHSHNLGVCSAKNSGARIAKGSWLVFLDSDDTLLNQKGIAVHSALNRNIEIPLHFFKCIMEDEEIPSTDDTSFVLRDFQEYMRKGTDGEALPIIRRDVFLAHPFDEDLRGYESLSYFRIVRKYKFAIINSLAARRYYTSHEDRLSSKSGMRNRYHDIAIGHYRVIMEHKDLMGASTLALQWIRYIKSILLKMMTRFPSY